MSDASQRVRVWLPPLGHPLVTMMLIALAVRGLGLAWHFFGNDLNGKPMVLMPMVHFPATFDYHYAVIMALGLWLLGVWRIWPSARRAMVTLGALGFGLIVALGQIDFTMLRLVGRRLDPSVLSTYVRPGLLTSEVVEPLGADGWHTAGSLGLILGGWALLAGVWVRGQRAKTPPRWSWPWWGVAVAVTMYLGSVPMRYDTLRTLMRPPEVVFWHALTREHRTPAPASPARVREGLLPPGEWAWVDDEHPLLRRPMGERAEPADRPDLIVLVVESLRGANLGFVNGEKPSPTPHLDALASAGVALPGFIANGFPSAVGFMALHTGSLPHRNRTIATAFTDRRFDALPVRLGALGYQRTAIWGGNPVMDNELDWTRRWYDEVDYQADANRWEYQRRRSDAETVDALIEHLRRADAAAVRRPQFLYVATAGMHEPFTAGSLRLETVVNRSEAQDYDPATMGDREGNYRRMLGELDRQVGRLAAFLRTRARRDHTVLLICGDHGVLLGEAVAHARRTYPVDGFVWTGAVLHGAPELVGLPRVETFPASQADVMPTLLALAGDDGPTAAVGVNLLDQDAGLARQAIAVREDGFRLDRGDWTLLVNARDAADFEVRPRFGGEPEEAAPLTADDAQLLHEAVLGWSWLVEQDRVWPGDTP